MDNWKITQDIMCNKLMQYIPNPLLPKASGTGSSPDSPNYLDSAFTFLNQAIDSQSITSIGLISSKRSGLLRSAVIFFKKAMRKLLFWYIEPICKAQTRYNEMNTQFNIKMFYQVQNNSKDIDTILHEDIDTKLSEQTDKLLSLIPKEIESKSKDVLEKTNAQAALCIQNVQGEIDTLEKRLNECSWKIDLLLSRNEKLQKENWELTHEMTALRQGTQNEMTGLRQETQKALELIRQDCIPDFENGKDNFWIKTTVAQSGEDSIIAYILMVLGIRLQEEFYLDLGANHAKELSNTYMLYTNGMRGVLVEANPQLIPELRFYRNEDIILNKCVSIEQKASVNFYILSGDGLSTTSWDSAQEIMQINPAITLKETISVDSITISEILDKYFEKAPLVLNIDLEGMEESILSTYDYEKYAPLIIIVERIDYSISLSLAKRADKISEILTRNGYCEYAFTGINSIYINKARMEEYAYANRV